MGFIGDIQKEAEVTGLLALVGKGFGGDDEKIPEPSVAVFRVVVDFHGEQRPGGMRTPESGHVEPTHLGISKVFRSGLRIAP